MTVCECVFVVRVACVCGYMCVFQCVNVCLCGLLFQSVFLFLVKHTDFLFCVKPQEAVAGGGKTEVNITFLALAFGVTVHPGTLHLPFFFSHDNPVGCSIQAHIREWNWSSGAFLPLLLIFTSNYGTGTTFLAHQTFSTLA